MSDPAGDGGGDEAASAVVERHLRAAIAVQELVLSSCVADIVRAAELIAGSFRAGGKLLICGNGGSAADAQHMAAEFVGRLRAEVDRDALPALALTTDTSFLTAYANDSDFVGVFARQVEALARSGDVLFCISTSGRSANVLRAARTARRVGVAVIGLSGEGGQLAGEADLAIVVPGQLTSTVQEAMLPIEHSICELVEDSLLRGSRPPRV